MQITLLLSLSPMKWPRHHLTNYRYLGRWKVSNSSIFGMQKAMKMRWGDSKNEIGPHVCHLWKMLPSMVGKRDHQLSNIEKPDWKDRHIPWENNSYSQKRCQDLQITHIFERHSIHRLGHSDLLLFCSLKSKSPWNRQGLCRSMVRTLTQTLVGQIQLLFQCYEIRGD